VSFSISLSTEYWPLYGSLLPSVLGALRGLPSGFLADTLFTSRGKLNLSMRLSAASPCEQRQPLSLKALQSQDSLRRIFKIYETKPVSSYLSARRMYVCASVPRALTIVLLALPVGRSLQAMPLGFDGRHNPAHAGTHRKSIRCSWTWKILLC
jgi:hypothetical protein